MAKPVPLTISTEYLPKEVGILRKEIEQLPRSLRDRLIYLQGRLFEMAQENLDRLQLEMKCLHFDLDCTRQERNELQEELENHTEGW
jgi:hypothetical protein